MGYFFSCDWGTSNLRLRLVNELGEIVIDRHSDNGIAKIFALWQQETTVTNSSRPAFYLHFVQQEINQVETKLNRSLTGVPVIMSGMGSSSIGFFELPYKKVPVSLLDPDLVVEKINISQFPHLLLLISGISTSDDVMRGEEMQLIGIANLSASPDMIYIMPGTHSKHVFVEKNEIVGFKTFMTGEFFELLSQKSILNASVENGRIVPFNKNAFRTGIDEALQTNLLNGSFSVRTNIIFGKIDKTANYDYLSGLLIGNELKYLAGNGSFKNITLIAGRNLAERYLCAFEHLGISVIISDPDERLADAIVARGHYKLYQKTFL